MYEKNMKVTVTAQSKTIGVAVEKGSPTFPEYSGETTFIPSQEMQTVQTQNTILRENIVINPIPNNYGLITYNGVFITVS